MSGRISIPSAGAPRRTVATRILLSFAVTLVAFAVTAGVSVLAQKRTAEDSEELATGYVPVALKLGQLRSVQSTLASLVDGIPDEKNPLSMRILLETLTNVRRARLDETAQPCSTSARSGARRRARAPSPSPASWTRRRRVLAGIDRPSIASSSHSTPATVTP